MKRLVERRDLMYHKLVDMKQELKSRKFLGDKFHPLANFTPKRFVNSHFLKNDFPNYIE